MSFIRIIPIIWVLCTDVSVRQEERSEGEEVRSVIINFFEGLSARDLGKMKACVSSDVRILEHGVVWTMDSLVSLCNKPLPSGFRRVNAFDFLQTRVNGDMAFVSYHNRADISTAVNQRTIVWLESAVLVRERRRWKIILLHSTRLPESNRALK